MATKHPYELTFVVSGVLNESQTQSTIDQVRNVIEDSGGEISEVDEWGSRRLAYQIDKKRSGYFVTVYFEAPGENIPRIERALGINDDVLRYLTLRMDPKMQRHYQTKKQRASEISADEE